MRWPFRRRPSADAAAPDNVVRVHIGHLPEVQVRHVIERKIPRPTSITFTTHRDDGSRYTLMPMDVSYRDSFEVEVPLRYIFNDHQMPGLRLRAQLHYDPKDRS